MVAQRLPQIGIGCKHYIFGRTPVDETIPPRLFIRWPPLFSATAAQINLAVDNPFTIINICLDGPIGIQDAASSTELYAALAAVAVRRNEVDTVLKGTGYPGPARGFFVQPVCGEEENVCTVQSRNPRGFEVFGVLADQAS